VKLIAQLQHPHILPVYDFGEYEGQPYIVAAYVSGGNLTDVINKGPMGLSQILRILKQLCDALDFAHGEGIVHRDFKPGNVLLDNQGNTYLADFGLARATEGDGQLTGSLLIGTPDYMAPDLSEIEGVTPLVDVYALGVTLYQMLSGHVPFQASTPMGVLMAHISTEIPNVLLERPELPEAVQEVVEGAMAKKVEARFQSAGDLFKAYNLAIGGHQTDSSSGEGEAQAAILFVNNQGQVIYLNNPMLRMTNRVESEARSIAGKPLYEILGTDKKITDQLIKDVNKIGNVNERPLELTDASGKKTNVLCTAAATYDENGKPAGADLSFKYISAPSGVVADAEEDEDDFTTGEKSYINLYFNSQVDALRVLLMRVGGPKLGDTLERIINETSDRNGWSIHIEDGHVKTGDEDQILEAHIFHALLVKAMTYAIGVIGVKMVEKQVQAVEEQMGERAVRLSKKLGLKEIFLDQR
jgi:serine/threonine-protein kinase